jgi:hypothetical protein
MAKQEQFCYKCYMSRMCDAQFPNGSPPCAALVEVQNTAHNKQSTPCSHIDDVCPECGAPTVNGTYSPYR